MTIWRKFADGAVLALGTMLLLTFGRPDAAAADPRPGDFNFISFENSPPFARPENAPEISVEKTGTLATTEGMILRVNADPGNVHIFTDESSRVSYCVRVEADSREPGAADFVQQFTVAARQTPSGVSLEGSLPWRTFRGQFGVSYEIHVPRRYNVEVHTLGGNIDLQDIEGHVDLFTKGGDISVGRVDAGTVSPHPSRRGADRVAAKLETLGGRITIGDVAGTLRATTSGGHITAGNIGGNGILRTGGGQIRTGRISGVAALDTGGGDITARFNEGSGQGTDDGKSVHKMRAASQLSSDDGDIVVYIPPKMAATIDAVVDRDGGHRVVADASLPLKINDQDSASSLRTIHFEGDLNGGGEILHLKAASGNIILKLGEPRTEWSVNYPSPSMDAGAGSSSLQPLDSDPVEDFNDAAGFFAELRQRILESLWGGIPVDAGEVQRHLSHSVAPVYPDVARRAGVEGDVVLRVLVSSEGRVTDLRVLDGPPILARAAVEAVRQWQYHALIMNGHPVAAVTTFTVSFRLH